MPMDGVVRPLRREAVIDTDANGQTRVNRLTYEVCGLEALRERLRSKETWVVGAATATRTRTCPPTSWSNPLPTMLLSVATRSGRLHLQTASGNARGAVPARGRHR